MKKYFKFAAYLLVALAFSSAHAGAYEDFFRALEHNDGGTVTQLLQRGMDPNTRDEKGQVALYVALRAKSPGAVAALWAHPGLDVDALNAAGETPLMMAALRGDYEWALKLLERGAKVHKEGWSPVHYAATGPNVKVLQLLLDQGAPVEALSPNGTTPLMMAARYGSEASVDLLLKRGADTRRRNQRDFNAADFARMDGRDALARRLEKVAR